MIGQITCDRMIIVLNKTDMLAADKRPALVEKMTRRLRATLANTKFSAADIVAVAAQPGGPDSGLPAQGLDDLMTAIGRQCFVPHNRSSVADGAPALFAVDHCFAIRGQGTVMTGTVLQGRIKVGDLLEIPSVAAAKKVKSIQMFRVGVERIGWGTGRGSASPSLSRGCWRGGWCVRQALCPSPSVLLSTFRQRGSRFVSCLFSFLPLNTLSHIPPSLLSKAYHVSY